LEELEQAAWVTVEDRVEGRYGGEEVLMKGTWKRKRNGNREKGDQEGRNEWQHSPSLFP
jgi:hypothetical protein